MKLKIYSDKNFLPEHNTQAEMLIPFWGPHENAKISGRFNRYIEVGPTFFEMTDTLAEADYAVLPADWKHYLQLHREDLAHQFARAVQQAGKPLIVFFLHATDAPVPFPNAFVFRTSFYRSGQPRRHFAIPNWNDDILTTRLEGRLTIRPKSEKPVVG